jgi:hypothetical protein
MKPLLLKTLVVGCLMGLVAVGYAQNEKKKGGKKKGNDPTAALLKKVDSASLGEELTAKVKKVIEEHAPKLREAQAKVNESLTAEQRAARQEAQKAAKAAGKKGQEAAAEVMAAMKLSDDQKKAYEEAQSGLRDATQAMNREIAALLTPEQRRELGVGGGKKKNQ